MHGSHQTPVMGKPNSDKISTSYVERFNLSTRMTNRRMTRLTNAFSKKAENHSHAMALQFFVYNFVKPHGTLMKAAKGVKATPAMAAGVTTYVWSVEDVLAKMDGLIGAESSVTLK